MIYLANTVVFSANTVVFGAKTVVFGTETVLFGGNAVVVGSNTVVFGGKYCGIWGKYNGSLCKYRVIWGRKNSSRVFSGVHKIFLKPEIRLHPSPVNTKVSESQYKTKTFSCEHKVYLLAFTRFNFFNFTRLCVHQRNLYLGRG